MTISAEFIDQIVHSVMREMKIRTPLNAPVALTEPIVAAPPADPTISISSRVLSERVLVLANAAGRAISIQPGTVITPSGRDYIRKNGVRLTSDVSVSVSGAVSLSGTFIAIGANTTTAVAAAAGWKSLTTSSDFDAASLASQHLSSGIVACCGGEPSVVACLLNRNPVVRAAVITRTTNMVKLATAMNPQVVCLESTGWSFGELLRLLRGLVMTTPAPGDWKELAGGTR